MYFEWTKNTSKKVIHFEIRTLVFAKQKFHSLFGHKRVAVNIICTYIIHKCILILWNVLANLSMKKKVKYWCWVIPDSSANFCQKKGQTDLKYTYHQVNFKVWKMYWKNCVVNVKNTPKKSSLIRRFWANFCFERWLGECWPVPWGHPSAVSSIDTWEMEKFQGKWRRHLK